MSDSLDAVVRCIYCDEELKPAPTTRGWVKKDRTHGICFPCIASLHRSMVAHQKAEAEYEKEHTPNASSEVLVPRKDANHV